MRERTENAARTAGQTGRTLSETGKVIQTLQFPDSDGKTGYKPDNRSPSDPPTRNQQPR